MMQPKDLTVGEIVQIDPTHDKRFGGCLMVVTDPKGWGAQGYVTVPHSDGAQQAFYRCEFANMESLNVTAEWQMEA